MSTSGVTARWKPSNGWLLSCLANGHTDALPSDAAPSICTVMPLMKAAPGDSSYTMAALTSASVPMRCSGTWALSSGIVCFIAPP